MKRSASSSWRRFAQLLFIGATIACNGQRSERAVPDSVAADSVLADSFAVQSGATRALERAVEAQADPRARASQSTIGFRSRAVLSAHFQKHGSEFGDITMSEYLHRAQALRDAPAGGDVLEIVRGDGVVSRFDRASGAFIAFNRDGTIRTFFRPNDGESYFRRQARRRGSG